MPKILIAYFSCSGVTERVAKILQEITAGDLFRIETEKPYPTQFNALISEVRREHVTGEKRPPAVHVNNMEDYEEIVLGYPNWGNTIPNTVAEFLKQYDFTGKTIAPFCTHGGSGIGRSVSDIKRLAKTANVLHGIEGMGGIDREKLERWVRITLKNGEIERLKQKKDFQLH